MAKFGKAQEEAKDKGFKHYASEMMKVVDLEWIGNRVKLSIVPILGSEVFA